MGFLCELFLLYTTEDEKGTVMRGGSGWHRDLPGSMDNMANIATAVEDDEIVEFNL